MTGSLGRGAEGLAPHTQSKPEVGRPAAAAAHSADPFAPWKDWHVELQAGARLEAEQPAPAKKGKAGPPAVPVTIGGRVQFTYTAARPRDANLLMVRCVQESGGDRGSLRLVVNDQIMGTQAVPSGDAEPLCFSLPESQGGRNEITLVYTAADPQQRISWRSIACTAPITGVKVVDCSSSPAGEARSPANTVGQYHFTIAPSDHPNLADGNMWNPDSGRDPEEAYGRMAHIVYDLGGIYEVSGMRVWNFNDPIYGGNISSSVKDVRISVSTTNPLAGTFAELPHGPDIAILETKQFPAAPGGPYPGVLFQESFRARYVRIDILTNWGPKSSAVGLSEIAFGGQRARELTTAEKCAEAGVLQRAGITVAYEPPAAGGDGYRRARIISMRGMRISDETLKPISYLSDVQELSLGETPITDAALVYLERLDGVKRIDLRGTQVTPAGKTRLQQALPKCQILY